MSVAHTTHDSLPTPLGLADHQRHATVDQALDRLDRATLHKDRAQVLLCALVEVVKLSFSQGRLQLFRKWQQRMKDK